MTEGTTVIRFQGVDITLPLSVSFAYHGGSLVLNFAEGFTGKLTLLAVGGASSARCPGGTEPADDKGLHEPSGLPSAPGCGAQGTATAPETTVVPVEEPTAAAYGADANGSANAPSSALNSTHSKAKHGRQPTAKVAAKKAARCSKKDITITAADQLTDGHLPICQPVKTDAASVPDKPTAATAATPVSTASAKPAGMSAPEAVAPTPVACPLAPPADAKTPAAPTVPEAALPEPPSASAPEWCGKENQTPAPQLAAPRGVSGSKEKRQPGSWTGGSVPSSSKRCKSSGVALRWQPLEVAGTEGQLPPERWGATLTALDDRQVCLFGGAHLGDSHLGDTWTLSLGPGPASWARQGAEEYEGKAWHTAQLLDTLQGWQLVVFGGERVVPVEAATQERVMDEDDDEVTVLSEVSALDTEAQLWVAMPITGDAGKGPPPRTGHTTTLLPDGRVLMFGGTDPEGKHHNDLYVIDTKRLNWFALSGIVRGAPPKPRAYHTATLVGKRVIVLGGAGSRTWAMKEVYSLHVEGWKWTEHTSEVDGEPPCARSGHAAVALPGGRYLLTYGGWAGESETCFSDVAILDTQTWRWTTPRIEGVARPSGRAGHATALVSMEGRSALLLHGGRAKDDKLCRDTWLLELPACPA